MAIFERLIGTDEVAAITGFSETYVKQLAREGKLPMHKIGKLWKTRESELDEWYRAQIDSGQKTGANPHRREV
jgi:excisionase family DNA binding protein